jgi:hypothetical protein
MSSRARSMAEILACPACQRKLQVPESFFGQTVQCPQCAHQFNAEPHVEKVTVGPTASAAPAPQPRTRAAWDDDDRPVRRRPYDDDEDDDDYDDYGARRRRHEAPHRGGLILALGLIGLVGGMSLLGLPFVLGPVAWILGNSDMREINEGRMDQSGEGLVQAGRVLGIISTVFLVLTAATYCLIFMMIAAASR